MVDLLVVLFGLYIPFLFFCCLNAYESHWCYILCTLYNAHWNKLNSKHSVAHQREWKCTSTPVFLRFKICHCKCRFYLPTTTITSTSFSAFTSTTTTIDMDIFNTLSLFTRDIQVFCLSSICLQTTATSSKDRLFPTLYKYFTNTELNFYNETELEKPSINWLTYFNCKCIISSNSWVTQTHF